MIVTVTLRNLDRCGAGGPLKRRPRWCRVIGRVVHMLQDVVRTNSFIH